MLHSSLAFLTLDMGPKFQEIRETLRKFPGTSLESVLYLVSFSYRAAESLISTSAVIRSWLTLLAPLLTVNDGGGVTFAAGDGWPLIQKQQIV